MRMRGLAALCGLVFLAGCSSVDVLAPIEDRSTTPPEVSVPVEGTEAHAVPVPTEGTFQPRHLTTEPTPQASAARMWWCRATRSTTSACVTASILVN